MRAEHGWLLLVQVAHPPPSHFPRPKINCPFLHPPTPHPPKTNGSFFLGGGRGAGNLKKDQPCSAFKCLVQVLGAWDGGMHSGSCAAGFEPRLYICLCVFEGASPFLGGFYGEGGYFRVFCVFFPPPPPPPPPFFFGLFLQTRQKE